MPLNNILVVHLAGMGDLLMGRIALEQLRQTHLHSHIVLLTWTRNLEAADLIPSIDEYAGLALGSSLTEIRHNLKTALMLRQARFDLAINCYQVYRQAGVMKLKFLLDILGARQSAGRDTDGKGWCFNKRVPERSSDGLHETQRQSRFMEQLGCRAVMGAAPLSVSMTDQQAADSWLTSHGFNAQAPFIALHPGSARPGHRWPAASFAEAGAEMGRQGLRVVVTGGPSERALAAEVAGKIHGAANAAGELSLGQLAQVLRRARVFLTNDSGPMHLASALNTPLVAIFGPGDPRHYGPYPLDRADQVVIHAQGDAVCYKSNCPGHEPLKRLKAGVVVDAMKAILSGLHPSGIQTIPREP